MTECEQASEKLREACGSGDLAEIRQVFSDGIATSEDATNVLEEWSDDPTICRLLLENGADPNAVDINLVESAEILRLLAEFGYDIKSQGHLVLQCFADDRDTVDWLLDQGVDINRTNTQRLDDDFSLAHGESDFSLHLLNLVAANADIEFFDHLVARGADPNRSLALHCASRCEDPERSTAMISHLLDKHGMDVHADTDSLRDFFHDAPDSGTPLCSAIYHRNVPVIKELIKRGSSITECGASGHDPVKKSIGNVLDRPFAPALEPLLDAGADANDALRYAVKNGNREAAEICVRYGADPAPALQQARDQENERLEKVSWHERDSVRADEAETQGRAMVELLSSKATSSTPRN